MRNASRSVLKYHVLALHFSGHSALYSLSRARTLASFVVARSTSCVGSGLAAAGLGLAPVRISRAGSGVLALPGTAIPGFLDILRTIPAFCWLFTSINLSSGI